MGRRVSAGAAISQVRTGRLAAADRCSLRSLGRGFRSPVQAYLFDLDCGAIALLPKQWAQRSKHAYKYKGTLQPHANRKPVQRWSDRGTQQDDSGEPRSRELRPCSHDRRLQSRRQRVERDLIQNQPQKEHSNAATKKDCQYARRKQHREIQEPRFLHFAEFKNGDRQQPNSGREFHSDHRPRRVCEAHPSVKRLLHHVSKKSRLANEEEEHCGQPRDLPEGPPAALARRIGPVRLEQNGAAEFRTPV